MKPCYVLVKGLHQLHKQLNHLHDLNFTARKLRQESRLRADKMSIQGVQAKLSARLSPTKQCFEIVSFGGTYILKPQSDTYPELAENEDLSMRLAKLIGIAVPLHSSLILIKRMDILHLNWKIGWIFYT